MTSKEHLDQLPDWIRRNRHWLALTVWVFIVLGETVRLLTQGANGAVDFTLRVIFFGLLCWSWGSRRDRNQPEFWATLMTGWSVLLVAMAVLTAIAALSGDFTPTQLLALGFVSLFLVPWAYSYRRTKRGLTWNRQPPNPH